MRAKMKYPAMSTGEQPMPISTIASLIAPGPVAAANRPAPTAPTASSRAVVRRGPTRSSALPTGICISEKARNHRPEAAARSSGVAPISAVSSGDSTARKAR